MASERAKALAEQQKADKRALKEARKNSTNPADWGRVRQIREAYRVTYEYDRQLPLWVFGGALLAFVLIMLLGLWLQPWWIWLILAVMAAATAALGALTWRVKGATYKRYAGQAGSAEVAMGMLPKEYVKSPVITATRQLDVVHRVVGPSGIVLIGEGDAGRVRQLLTTEAKKHEAVKFGVPVTTLVCGDKEKQIPLDKLAAHIRKLPKALQGSEVLDVAARLRALDAMRPKVPLPKGPLPTSAKGSRQAMRGR